MKPEETVSVVIGRFSIKVYKAPDVWKPWVVVGDGAEHVELGIDEFTRLCEAFLAATKEPKKA